jgi:serine/threonine protein kinase
MLVTPGATSASCPAARTPPDYATLFVDLFRLDIHEINLDPTNSILLNTKSYIYRYQDRYAVSIRRVDAIKELEMMRSLQGISIPVEGYVLQNGWLEGYVMPLASPVPTNISVIQKKGFMDQMIALVDGIHNQGILHGDIKLANFLHYNGKLWLCDFEESQRFGEENRPSSATQMYRPPWRVRANIYENIESPLSIDDDLYGLGLSIWELFSGHRVYEDLDGVEAEEQYIVHGEVVNVEEANDPVAVEIIWKYLERGSRGVFTRGSKVYEVTGPPHESLTVSEYFRGVQRRMRDRGLQYEIPTSITSS